MVDHSAIREHMDVIDADGHTIGRVDSFDGSRIKLTRKDSPDGQHHYIDAAEVARVDSHVHLLRSAAALFGAGADAAGAGAVMHDSDRDRSATGAGRSWLPWMLGGIALVALIAALSQCENRDRTDAGADPVPANTAAVAPAGAFATGTMAYDVDRYLAGSEAAPRSFAFQRLNFDSGSAQIRDEDESDLDDIARVLTAYPQVRAAVVGYTDAEGPAASNTELGAQRARAVVAALGARGVASTRLEARTGGESNPEASNADAGGMAANRRTELVILSR
jgi:outer membrane protein OmpA-like peptidoglycan-associated protein